jgi:hypothetical protein
VFVPPWAIADRERRCRSTAARKQSRRRWPTNAGVAAVDANASVSDLGDIAARGMDHHQPALRQTGVEGRRLNDLFAIRRRRNATHLAGWHGGLLVAGRVAGTPASRGTSNFKPATAVSVTVTGEVSSRPVPSRASTRPP